MRARSKRYTPSEPPRAWTHRLNLVGIQVVLRAILVLGAFLALPSVALGSDCTRTSVGLTPLDDLGTDTYQGVQGGLYPGGSRARPAGHEVAGQLLADAVVPRDAVGTPSAGGRYGLLSIGMSNTTQEFSQFIPLANADPAKDPRLVPVDGAQGGQTAQAWSDPNAAAWNVADQRIAAAGLSPSQISVAWVKLADAGPTNGWPAYAQTLQARTAQVVQNLHDRYPNLTLVYLSSRIYAGYASTMLNPEPYAYEGGFSVKWLVEDQIDGSAALNFDQARGPVEAPWLSWGPYLWADGLTARSDGLTWECSDLAADGTHPSTAGQIKVAQMLLDFFKADSTARLWFSPPAQTGRAVTLTLRKHLVARGEVAATGFVGCEQGAAVNVQRRRRGRWRGAGSAVTDASGAFRVRLRDRPGRYRAELTAGTTGAEGTEACQGAVSELQRHRDRH